MGPTGKLNGKQNLFCANTRCILNCKKCTKYPMPQCVVNKVDKWGEKTKKTVYGNRLEFRNCNKYNYDWNIEDGLYGLI